MSVTETENAKLLRALAQEALAVQDASNLSGVLGSAQRACIKLKTILGGNVADSHPIMQLWADKIAQLAHTQYAPLSELMQAYTIVNELAK
jgi:hypothetical protein